MFRIGRVGVFQDVSPWQARGSSDEIFLVVGEELSVPLALVQQRRLDGLRNEEFKRILATLCSAATTTRNRASSGPCGG